VSDCADQATGPVDDAVALAVCTDLVADLAGIGSLMGLLPRRATLLK
jgi:hypothetical protein